MGHLFKKIDIEVSKEKLEEWVKLYIDLRGGIQATGADLESDIISRPTGFNIERIQEVIIRHTVPMKPDPDGEQKKHLNIYRSDLGELLMVLFFEKELSEEIRGEENFIIPIKNIRDRETNDQPGRGIDVIGYRVLEQDKPTLFLGEAKVSTERRNPPGVVDKNDDSMYKTHLKHAVNKTYLLRKLCNYAKKLQNKDASFMYLIIYNIEYSSDEYDVVYGCCMVRDNECVSVDSDYGKLLTQSADFDPHSVYFYIPSFSLETVDVVVERFLNEVLKQSNNDN